MSATQHRDDADQREYLAAAERVFAGDEVETDNPLFRIGIDLMGEFNTAEKLRHEVELRWLNDLRQYKGQYEPDEVTKLKGSKAFMRKTRVKVESVDARMMDLLFPANRLRNFGVEATPEPSIPTPMKRKLIELLTAATGQPPDEATIQGAVQQAAQQAASKMETRISDQLSEGRYRDEARKVLHSGNLYGTGILKGPLVERRERVSYVWQDEANKKKGGFVRESHYFAAPFMTEVPLWRWYPDMNVTRLEDARFAWEHHRLSKAYFAALADRKTFRSDVIKSHINTNPYGSIRPRTYESELRNMGDQKLVSFSEQSYQYDVFERWGWIDAKTLAECGIKVPEDRMHETFFGNVWVLPGGEIIKVVLNPIEGMEWPYHLYYLDKDETSIFGEGLAAIMRDDQRMLNAAVRMLLDNAAICAGPQFEVLTKAFAPGTRFSDIHPLKVWPRTGGDMQYPAIRALNFDSHMDELLKIMQVFDANADEVTAIPKFTYGDNPQKGAAGTMGGLSMLLGQANISLKDLVVSWDEGITKPFIQGMFYWNMKFGSDDTIKGDFNVVAKGASSLIAKEVRGQALAQFGATLQPEERPRVKWKEFSRQKAEAFDLEDIVMSDEEFKTFSESPENQQAMQMQQMQAQLQLAKLQAEVADKQAQAAERQAKAMNTKIEGIYAALQGAGIIVENPEAAPAGDAILQRSGWKDAEGSGDVVDGSGIVGADGQPVQGIPDNGDGTQPTRPGPRGAGTGQRQGINTVEFDG